MAFCTKCGTQLKEGANFCAKCGNPVKAAQPVEQQAVAVAQQPTPVQMEQNGLYFYRGIQRHFPLCGKVVTVSSGMDVFNYYRKTFLNLARIQADALRREYMQRINDLDSFLVYFPEMYSRYRQPLLDLAVDIFPLAGIYDLSPEQFERQHTNDFCLCGEDVDVVIESFNLTIEANQERKVRMYNMMPGVVFSGLAGFAAAIALNAAVTAIAEADIRNADVSRKQRQELYERIDFDVLMERAFVDYWRVFLSLTWWMNQKGLDVWYPNDQDNSRAEGLYQNLLSGRIPQQVLLDQYILLLQLNPYADDHLQYLLDNAGVTNETAPIFDYFDFDY